MVVSLHRVRAGDADALAGRVHITVMTQAQGRQRGTRPRAGWGGWWFLLVKSCHTYYESAGALLVLRRPFLSVGGK